LLTCDSKRIYLLNDYPYEAKWFIAVLEDEGGKQFSEVERIDIGFVKGECKFEKLEQPRSPLAGLFVVDKSLLLLYSNDCKSNDNCLIDRAALYHCDSKKWDKFDLKGEAIPNYSVFVNPSTNCFKNKVYYTTVGFMSIVYSLDLGTHTWALLDQNQVHLLMDAGMSKSSTVTADGTILRCYKYKHETDTMHVLKSQAK